MHAAKGGGVAGQQRKVAIFDVTGTLMYLREPPGDTYFRIATKHGFYDPHTRTHNDIH